MTASAWITLDVVEEVKKESLAAGAFLNPSKLTDKERRVRFLGEGITGWSGWTNDDKPIRFELKPAELPDILKVERNGKPGVLKRFFATAIYDYETDEFKIFEFSQKQLIDSLFKYIADVDYGQPTGYDIKLSKTGTELQTKYSLVAAPPKPVSKEILARYDEWPCNLHALFDNADPFGGPSA